MPFFLLLNVKMSTIVGILTFMSRNCWHFIIYEQEKFHTQLSLAWKKFYNLAACSRWERIPSVAGFEQTRQELIMSPK